MKGVYINIYYPGKNKFGAECTRVHHVHTGHDRAFCDRMRNAHSKAKLERERRWRR